MPSNNLFFQWVRIFERTFMATFDMGRILDVYILLFKAMEHAMGAARLGTGGAVHSPSYRGT